MAMTPKRPRDPNQLAKSIIDIAARRGRPIPRRCRKTRARGRLTGFRPAPRTLAHGANGPRDIDRPPERLWLHFRFGARSETGFAAVFNVGCREITLEAERKAARRAHYAAQRRKIAVVRAFALNGDRQEVRAGGPRSGTCGRSGSRALHLRITPAGPSSNNEVRSTLVSNQEWPQF